MSNKFKSKPLMSLPTEQLAILQKLTKILVAQ